MYTDPILFLLRLVWYTQKARRYALFLMGILCMHIQIAHTAELPFQEGETLTYNVHCFGIHAGTAMMQIDASLHPYNGHNCYKVQIEGTSSKTLALIGFKIANRWESYLDVDGLRPHRFFARIQENNYTREEKIDFDYLNNQAKMTVAESIHNMKQEVSYFSFDKEPIMDIISMYYALRAMDTSKLKINERLSLGFLLHDRTGLHNNEGILFLGKKTVDTKLGKISTLVFAPIIPTEGTIFSGKRAVEIFVSDDANKIPIKLKINLLVGAVEMELASYKGLKGVVVFQNP